MSRRTEVYVHICNTSIYNHTFRQHHTNDSTKEIITTRRVPQKQDVESYLIEKNGEKHSPQRNKNEKNYITVPTIFVTMKLHSKQFGGSLSPSKIKRPYPK